MHADALFAALAAALLGAGLASVLACLPGMHLWALLCLAAGGLRLLSASGVAVPPELLPALAGGCAGGYLMASAIPAALLDAPDESSVFALPAARRLRAAGCAAEAVALLLLGSLAGLTVPLALALAAPRLPLALGSVLQAHAPWLAWTLPAFLLLTERPRAGFPNLPAAERLRQSWRPVLAAAATLLLSGGLGLVLVLRPPAADSSVFQSLLPALAGLFTVPWLLERLAAPAAERADAAATPFGAARPAGSAAAAAPALAALGGLLTGALGGTFALLVPGLTGGVGGMLAGPACGLRDDRALLVSQGAAKSVYVAGGVLLLFAVRRGAGWWPPAWAPPGALAPGSLAGWVAAAGGVALGGVAAYLLCPRLARGIAALADRAGPRRASAAALALVTLIAAAAGGWAGVLVLAAAAAIGLLPLVFGARPAHGLGVVLIPLACSASGITPVVARWLGLG